MRIVIWILVGAAVTLQPARAQIRSDGPEGTPFFGPVINHSDFYVTKPVAESYRRSAAADFARGAGQAGFNGDEIKSFAAWSST